MCGVHSVVWSGAILCSTQGRDQVAKGRKGGCRDERGLEGERRGYDKT